MVDHYPNPQKVIDFWGSKEHWRIVNNIDFHKNCDRCTLTAYNEFFEQIFIEDKMDRWLI
jgi:N-acetylneuraminic acid mutarotase